MHLSIWNYVSIPLTHLSSRKKIIHPYLSLSIRNFLPSFLRKSYSEIGSFIDVETITRVGIVAWAFIFVLDVMYLRERARKLSVAWRAINMMVISYVVCGPVCRIFQIVLGATSKTLIQPQLPMFLSSIMIGINVEYTYDFLKIFSYILFIFQLSVIRGSNL